MVLIFGISILQSPENVYSGLCNLQKMLNLSIVFSRLRINELLSNGNFSAFLDRKFVFDSPHIKISKIIWNRPIVDIFRGLHKKLTDFHLNFAFLAHSDFSWFKIFTMGQSFYFLIYFFDFWSSFLPYFSYTE